MFSRPGELVTISEFARERHSTRTGGVVRVAQWNIERGYRLEGIVRELRETVEADILCCQEIDIGCARSGGANCLKEIASALGMYAVFVAEFVEIASPVRKERDQGGGVHGNAIFSKFPMHAQVIRHAAQPVDWEKEGTAIGEPRIGARFALRADIEVPGWRTPLRIWCAHLEVFCGITSRVAQISDILHDAASQEGTGGQGPIQIIAGDLNTMAHGIARLSWWYCRDSLRFWTVGQTEPSWWQQNVFNGSSSPTAPFNESLRRWGLPEPVCRAAVNPGFVESFPRVDEDFTLSNHCGLYTAKLDWILCRGLVSLENRIGNHSFELSDHKWISSDVQPLC